MYPYIQGTQRSSSDLGVPNFRLEAGVLGFR